MIERIKPVLPYLKKTFDLQMFLAVQSTDIHSAMLPNHILIKEIS
jgi:hypothetical protein